MVRTGDSQDRQQYSCPADDKITCNDCGNQWQSENQDWPAPGSGRSLADYVGECESCGSRNVALMRCPNCPVAEIETARLNTPAGRLLERILDLDFDSKHFKIDWADVTAEEALALKILEQERAKYDKESAERRREEAEMEQRMRLR